MRYLLSNINLDFLGFGASFLCAIHCAALPFIVSILPLAGRELLGHEWVEYTTIILSFIIASMALFHGYNGHHRKLMPLLMVALGFICIGFGHLIFTEGHFLELVFTVTGALIISAAHIVNWKLITKSKELSKNNRYAQQKKHLVRNSTGH